MADHVYISQFQDELILLDTKKDKYTICSNEFSELLLALLDLKKPVLSEDFLLQKVTAIQQLINEGIIERKKNPFTYYIDRKIDSEGVSNVDWTLPIEKKKVDFNFSVFQALVTLIYIHFCIKFKGLYSTIQLIKKSRKIGSNYIIPQGEELVCLANTVSKACFIYPKRTKCLEWAMTFILLALKRNWKCNLEIGVQNYPFFAHAWVECDGKVVMDSGDLRSGLSIILNEPFRKLIT